MNPCERLAEKFGKLEPAVVTTPDGSCQFRCLTSRGGVVATWILRKGRLSYSSGFLFGNDEGLVKLSSRDLTKLLEGELDLLRGENAPG